VSKIPVRLADLCEKAQANAHKYAFLEVIQDEMPPTYPDPLVAEVVRSAPTLLPPPVATPIPLHPQPNASAAAFPMMSPFMTSNTPFVHAEPLPPQFSVPPHFSVQPFASATPLATPNTHFPMSAPPSQTSASAGLEFFGEDEAVIAESAGSGAEPPQSDYERKREANIRANNEKLKSLGLGDNQDGAKQPKKRGRAKPKEPKERDASRDSRELRMREDHAFSGGVCVSNPLVPFRFEPDPACAST
jgi:hypothetical protein